MMNAADIHSLIGSKVNNRYRLVHVLGSGSFATVFLAIDLVSKQKVAVKCLCKLGLTQRQQAAHKKEAAIMASLSHHPNIITLLDTVETEDYCFLVMENCEMDLYEAITSKEGFPDDVVREVFNQIIDALICCHDNGIYHRDIKPENILVASDYTTRLTDFGLSTLEKWSYEFGCGSVRYMAPECISSEDEDIETKKGYSPAQNDVWSLGIILINLLFGKNPWHEAAETDAIYHAYLHTNPNILQDNFNLHCTFHQLLKRILDPNPKTRLSLVQLQREFNCIQKFTNDPVAYQDDLFAQHDFTLFGNSEVPSAPRQSERQTSVFSDILDDYLSFEGTAPVSTPITPKDQVPFQFWAPNEKTPFDTRNMFGSLPSDTPALLEEW